MNYSRWMGLAIASVEAAEGKRYFKAPQMRLGYKSGD